jgi:hypothetical protein
MTEKEFLENITYTTSSSKKRMTVWYVNQIINTISFEDVIDKLEDDEYCTKLSEEIALQSRLYEELVKN